MYSGVFYERYRITPAYAGKSFPAGCPRSRSRDHPRVCGEKAASTAIPSRGQGSPPRMRGKGWLMVTLTVRNRITPAYAGKSISDNSRTRTAGDHPRVCGEKSTSFAKAAALCRITPAYAGKSQGCHQCRLCCKDHPRVCGEKFLAASILPTIAGSPPRMRGKADDCVVDAAEDRITPAYAGKRLKRSRSTVPPVAIVPLFPSVCNKPVVSDGSPAGRDAPLFLPAENAVPASPAYNLRSL